MLPVSAQAACLAAPMATLSKTSVVAMGRPKTAGAICRTAGDCAAPPVRVIRLMVPVSQKLASQFYDQVRKKIETENYTAAA